ncbi:MAG: SWIM zinc finger family protein [Planctomycetaceae bacterium]
MAATSVSYAYRYPFESAVMESVSAPAMRLATSPDGTSDDLFFDGALKQPALVGKCLTVLSSIVRTRFYQPLDPMLLDPVVTSGGGMLRFEGFSSCCGVYARVDLAPEAFDTDLRGKGTTNVDFNDAMRTALRRLSDNDDAQLQVGGEGVTLRTDSDRVVERKVKLPVRWIKGFCEVQAYQPRMTVHFELDQNDVRTLFRAFPKGSNAKRPVHITRTGRTMRLASRPQRGSVQLEGADRVRVLEPLIPYTKQLNIWYDEDAGTSGWELQFGIGRMFTLVSPELNRGFSGEGQMLSRLATGQWQTALPAVTDSLNWQSHIDISQLSRSSRAGEAEIEAALAVLGARGLVGFDVATGKYFHRVLPFDMDRVETQQPRLVAARKLIDADGVKLFEQTPDGPNYQVAGTDVEHFIRLRHDGDRCTCQWFNRYQGQRGPCKHILAARIVNDGEDSDIIRSAAIDDPTTQQT